MNFQRVLLAIGSIIIVGLVLVIVLQQKRLEQFMTIQEGTTLTGKTLSMMEGKTPAMCETECKRTSDCKAAVIRKDGTCMLKSTIGNPMLDKSMSSLRFPCELYDGIEFHGSSIMLEQGDYDLTDLEKKGYKDKALMSIRVQDGYRVTLYDKRGFSGNFVSFTASQPDLGVVVRDASTDQKLLWSNAVSSLVIEKTN
jgi:hypothetical protein